MPSFRAPKVQATHAVSQRLAIGEASHKKEDSRIHSIGTAVAYTQSISTYTRWIQAERLGDLRSAGRTEALRYLELRSTEVGQAQLNKDRQALQSLLGERLPVLKSEVEVIRGSKLYTAEQLSMIQDHQTRPLATALVGATAIRAHELLTLRPAIEQQRSSHREWRADLHTGIEGRLYSVVGKGGLIREVMIPADLAERLEAGRLAEPQIIIDRGVRYVSYYHSICVGGQAWSQSFSAASRRALGWSAGGHAVRATWACARVAQLQSMGYGIDDAKSITSQNLGHFRPDVLDYYLER